MELVFLFIGIVINLIILLEAEKMTKEVKELFTRDDGLWYAKGAKKPFTGSHKLYHDNGLIESEANYKDGKLDGRVTAWHENRQKSFKANYKDGKEDGKMAFWYENGQKRQEANSKDGEYEGIKTE